MKWQGLEVALEGPFQSSEMTLEGLLRSFADQGSQKVGSGFSEVVPQLLRSRVPTSQKFGSSCFFMCFYVFSHFSEVGFELLRSWARTSQKWPADF